MAKWEPWEGRRKEGEENDMIEKEEHGRCQQYGKGGINAGRNGSGREREVKNIKRSERKDRDVWIINEK